MRRPEAKDSDTLMLVCHAASLGEALTLRASLEAHGVPTLLEGEHQGGCESLHGPQAALRILVPRAALPVARELAAEIIPLPEPAVEPEAAADVLVSLTPARLGLVFGALVGVGLLISGDPLRGSLVLGGLFVLAYLGVLPLERGAEAS